MKIYTKFLVVGCVSFGWAFTGATQTLFVPSGTGGIGASSNGNVGIDITSPAAKLHVSGNNQELRLDYNGTDSYYGSMRWAGVQLGNNGANRFIAGRTNAGGWFEFYVNNTNEAADYSQTPDGIFSMALASSGFVGIGTTVPDRWLTVAGSDTTNQVGGSAAGIHIVNTNASAASRVSEITFGGRVPSAKPFAAVSAILTADSSYEQTGHLVFSTKEYTSATFPIERMRITESGNVGIGTSSPDVNLEVEAKSGDAEFHVDANSSGSSVPVIRLQKEGVRKWGWLGEYPSAGAMSFFSYDLYSPVLVLNSSGNVGIGTTTPSHKLSVNGTIRAKEVIVDTGWADHVFAADYGLRSLAEVETFIGEKGHLPDVPSAKTVETEGLSVGDAQRIMMQKIEELTLYMIEKERQITSLQNEVARLRLEVRGAIE